MALLRPAWRALAIGAVAISAALLGPVPGSAVEPAAAPAEGAAHWFNDLNGCRKVVFVLNRSGSMLNTLNTVKDEVAKAVAGLKPQTKFDIIAASESTTAFSPRLVPADEAGKKKALAWLDELTLDPHTTLLLPGMKTALGLQPDRICFTSDGDVPDPIDFAIRVCQLAGPEPVTRIDTVGLATAFSPLPSFACLRLIARHTGGTFRAVRSSGERVREADLPRAGPEPRDPPHLECAGLRCPFPDQAAFVLDLSLRPGLRRLAEREIARSIEGMGKDARFGLIGFDPAGGAPASFAPALVPATAGNRRRAAEWLTGAIPPPDAGAAPEGAAAPPAQDAALVTASRQNAAVVYFLYGPDADLKALRRKAAELNEKRKSGLYLFPIAVVEHRPPGLRIVAEKVDDQEFTLRFKPEDEASRLPREIAEENQSDFGWLAPEDEKSPPGHVPQPAR